MNIFILDSGFNIIDIIDRYTSIIWTTRYYDVGDFELFLPATPSMVSLLSVGRYLVREQDMVSNGSFQNVMVICNREIQTDAEDGDNLIVSGYDLKSILRRRVVASQTNLSGTVEACIRNLVDDALISPVESARKVSGFSLGTDGDLTEYSIKMQVTGENLCDVVTELCQTYGYGFDISVSSGGMLFYLYEGKNRSYGQNVLPYVVFSPYFDNIVSSDYVSNRDSFANVAYVAGEGEGTARRKVVVGTASGLDRYEVWVDSRNTSSNDGEITDAEYNAMLSEEGETTLADMRETVSYSGEVLSTVNYALGSDYFLGDIVQVENDYGLSAAVRIIEIIDSEDEGGRTVIPTFSEMEV